MEVLFFVVLLCASVFGGTISVPQNIRSVNTTLQNAGTLQARGQNSLNNYWPDKTIDGFKPIDPAKSFDELKDWINEAYKVLPMSFADVIDDKVCYQGQFYEDKKAELQRPPWNLSYETQPWACLEPKWFTRPKPDPPKLDDCPLRAGLAITEQFDAPPGLSMLSHPADAKRSGRHHYFTEAGRGITVYVVDNFRNYLHPSRFNVEPRSLGPIAIREHDDVYSHGFMVAATVADRIQGVAENAQVVAVLIAYDSRSAVDSSSDFHVAMKKIIKDVKERRLEGKAVINLSFSFGDPTSIKESEILFREAERLGIILVSAAGNLGPRRSTKNQFNTLARTTNIPIIMVGALSGPNRSKQSQGYLENDIWASGDMTWSGRMGRQWDPFERLEEGTSFAAARVSGLAAYFMSTVDFQGPIESRSQLVKDYIIHQARRDSKYGALIADNGMTAWRLGLDQRPPFSHPLDP